MYDAVPMTRPVGTTTGPVGAAPMVTSRAPIARTASHDGGGIGEGEREMPPYWDPRERGGRVTPGRPSAEVLAGTSGIPDSLMQPGTGPYDRGSHDRNGGTGQRVARTDEPTGAAGPGAQAARRAPPKGCSASHQTGGPPGGWREGLPRREPPGRGWGGMIGNIEAEAWARALTWPAPSQTSPAWLPAQQLRPPSHESGSAHGLEAWGVTDSVWGSPHEAVPSTAAACPNAPQVRFADDGSLGRSFTPPGLRPGGGKHCSPVALLGRL